MEGVAWPFEVGAELRVACGWSEDDIVRGMVDVLASEEKEDVSAREVGFERRAVTCDLSQDVTEMVMRKR